MFLRIVGSLHCGEHLQLKARLASGSFDKGFHVLGETRAAITTAGVQKVVANTRIRPNTLAHHFNVRTQFFGQIGQLIHETDTCGQHGVGSIFGELGAARVGHDQALAVALKRRVQRTHQQNGLLVGGANDDAVRAHEVFHRRALLEKLRIGHHGIGRLHPTLSQLIGNRRMNPVGGAHRDRALVDDDFVIGHETANIARGCQHVLHIGRAVLAGWCAHRNELDRAVLHSACHIGGEVQAPGGHIALHHFLQARFENGNTTGF